MQGTSPENSEMPDIYSKNSLQGNKEENITNESDGKKYIEI